MRRLMLAMSQEKLGDALGLTFQQVQKYEKGTNRIGASRLQQISHILQVPVAFFFEGAPNLHGSTDRMKEAPLLPTCRISSPPPKGSFWQRLSCGSTNPSLGAASSISLTRLPARTISRSR